ncbi:MAG: DUF5752 family protein [Candidatus Undinarchaeales archaeon]|jgi:hypothetical protein|nr:DUF5752 family protein [Candidatus Undinarchaeales archaeon]MDP7492400.1 DUF5752 family protein [Candidatus Undinarchaeales archaeon]
MMPSAPDGSEFIVKSSEDRVEGAARDIMDLHWIILGMAPEGLLFHIRSESNDVANWVREVIQDRTLADSLEELDPDELGPRELKDRVLEVLEDWMI